MNRFEIVFNYGDEELVEEYGEYEEIKDLSDEKLLDIFAFMHSFRC